MHTRYRPSYHTVNAPPYYTVRQCILPYVQRGSVMYAADPRLVLAIVIIQ